MKEENRDTIKLCGWVENLRDLGKILFIKVRDDSGYYQVTIIREESSKIFEEAKKIKPESVISLNGIKRANKKVINGYEIIPQQIELMSEAEQPVPLNLNENVKSSLDKEIDYRFLSLRKPSVASIFKIQSTVSNAIVEFFQKNGFYQIHSSKIVSQATEGGANVFPVIYFDRTAYLAQSPQFYKQMMMSAGLEKVFEIGPVFRAEPHHTSRHLTEYTSVDIEMSFIKSYEDVMDIMEDMMIYLFKKVRKTNVRELKSTGASLKVPRKPFPRINMADAAKILEKYGNRPKDGGDIDPEGERILGEYVKERYGAEIFFLTEFPWTIAQFYHMRSKENPNITYRADMIYKGLEITTLAQREHRYDVLVKQLKEKGLDQEKFQFYLDFFRYGVPPHGGSGTGLERIVKQMLNLENVAEATLLPRTPDRLTP